MRGRGRWLESGRLGSLGGEDCVGQGEETGFEQYCAHTKGHAGIHINGCFAEYVRVDERFTTKLPDELSFVEAVPLVCAGRTAWKGLRVGGVWRGEWLLVLGSGGGLGHSAVQFAIGLGGRVVGVDARGAKDEVVEDVQRVTGGLGVHASGATALAAAATRMHGTVVQIAQPEEVVLPFRELVFRDVRVGGELGYASFYCGEEEEARI
ncbi:uncharacterized protein GGS22DRAFT_188792 [Annulohypoxylon maeteangense]|uniref:uncharacterized protein n=1 Tax=Annulohypoxylon maeteangense TaxID=1927788 RepID=UPI00200843BA|nr:uncharacterized protein GGS22DRAFT_188792 [Annulohypoxylon maeteangense]KAI0884585.1 hypothetical protein GGS22DRAFT_188792 [Annulohypoxylon maeteangense]